MQKNAKNYDQEVTCNYLFIIYFISFHLITHLFFINYCISTIFYNYCSSTVLFHLSVQQYTIKLYKCIIHSFIHCISTVIFSRTVVMVLFYLICIILFYLVHFIINMTEASLSPAHIQISFSLLIISYLL